MGDFIDRTLRAHLIDMTKWFPAVSLTGPRQSGKSTLVRNALPHYSYVSLEDPQTRAAALEDPVSFIRNRDSRLIIDEAQYAPDIFSMIQVVSDERGESGQYVLTGSQNFLMLKSIGQSLAGRVGILKLLPLSFRELQDSSEQTLDVDGFALKGGYPRMHDLDIPPSVYFPSYLDTYVARDVAGLLDVRDKTSFTALLGMCAQTTGNLLNVASLSRNVGVAVQTIRSWLSILESSYIVFMLQPYHANMGKRLSKTPKLYFYDTGLLCHLLKIENVTQMIDSPLFGAIFENLIIAEIVKGHLGAGRQPELYYYRDESKREIDLLDFTYPNDRRAMEIKSSRTYHDRYARHLNAIGDDLSIDRESRYVIARVDSSYRTGDCRVLCARDFLSLGYDFF